MCGEASGEAETGNPRGSQLGIWGLGLSPDSTLTCPGTLGEGLTRVGLMGMILSLLGASAGIK